MALHIISRSDAAFADRAEAGRLLAEQLHPYAGPATLVLGVPRGGMLVACEVARSLGAQLDIALARKIGAPGNPELAIGAISEGGEVSVDPFITGQLMLTDREIQRASLEAYKELQRRAKVYRTGRPAVNLAGKTAILVDDGVATGATVRAALMAARKAHPTRLVLAVPVGPEDTVQALAELADEAFCLRCPPYFDAVGRFYVRFDQVSDEEMLACLR